MRITPLDIQQKQFPIKFRGFDVEEVYAFLEIVREEMEALIRENSMLKENVSRLEGQLREFKDMEVTLRETLLTAQQMVEDYKNNSIKESELIMREAEMKAETMIKLAQEKVINVHEDIVDLKGIRRHFKEELNRLIKGHLQMLEFDNEREDLEDEMEPEIINEDLGGPLSRG
ncbi:MAG TPA: DivIVA domain-containing protein [Nitrospirae bacterium]|nr:DivIVA domain-containing protein [Nitrospirota bacterium]